MINVYNATPKTITDGEICPSQCDANGNIKVTQAIKGCNATLVDLATDADVVVTASPAYLLGYTVDTIMSAHVALIKDSTTTKFTVPASSAAGFDRDTRETSFATNITVESNDAATGKIIIFWKAA
jgi:hypothetical protein